MLCACVCVCVLCACVCVCNGGRDSVSPLPSPLLLPLLPLLPLHFFLFLPTTHTLVYRTTLCDRIISCLCVHVRPFRVCVSRRRQPLRRRVTLAMYRRRTLHSTLQRECRCVRSLSLPRVCACACVCVRACVCVCVELPVPP